MAPAENTPDFDAMSPEEIMAWMESLAKRQGANPDELTTAANVDVPEIDPNNVVIDEPGYVPYGEERPVKPEERRQPPRAEAQDEAPPPLREEPSRPSAAPPMRPAAGPTPGPRPGGPPGLERPPYARPSQPGAPFAQPPQRPQAPPQPLNPFAREPQRELPAAPPPRVEPSPAPRAEEPLKSPGAEPPAVMQPASPLGTDAMEWLESLAADQGDSLFNIDLSALSDELERPAPKAEEPAADPLEWLEHLASPGDAEATKLSPAQPQQREAPQQPAAPSVSDPFASGVDPMTWLENLARRQGARNEELTTSAEMDIPLPENATIDEPGYKPFVPERRAERAEPEDSLDLDDPTDWLESLADSQGFDGGQFLEQQEREEAREPARAEQELPETGSLEVDDIERAIAAGTVTPEQMQYYLERQTDRYVEIMDEDEDDEAEAEPPVPADLPDWLLDQVGPPPVAQARKPTTELPPLTDVLKEPPQPADIPDWLKDDSDADIDFQNIFADSPDAERYEAPAEGEVPDLFGDDADEAVGEAFTIEPDPNDPWVEAFDAEQARGNAEPEDAPEWYERNVRDPERIAAVERIVQISTGQLDPEAVAEAEARQLAEAALPAETELAAGETIAMPAWMRDGTADDVSEEAAGPSEKPADVPEWLQEAGPADQPEEIPEWLRESMEEEPAAMLPEPDIVAELPAEAQAAPSQPEVGAEPREQIEAARQAAREGNLAACLAGYESLVRLNVALETVVEDLEQLVRAHRDNPAVYRVLGDGLMRQGKLQAALDIYRQALNQL